VRLSLNETTIGPSPLALEAMRKELQVVQYYPEGSSLALRKKIAQKLDIDPDCVLVSFGADNIIMLLGQAFLDSGDEVILADLSFPTYMTMIRIMQAVPVKAPLKDYANDLDAVADRITQKTKLIFITNPHNPTGCVTTRKEVERFLSKAPEHVVVVMDEAYFDYAENPYYPNSLDYMNGDHAVIGLRTFSKIAGLAGARIGYAMAESELIGCLKRVVQPYGICCLSQAAALATLDDDGHLKKVLELNRAGRETFHRCFDEMGLSYSRSETNFVFVKVGQDAKTVYRKMRDRGVIIRPILNWGTGDYIRISIGTPEQNERCIQVFKEVLE
jgi:histidinol-phosphate aminotransferase